MDPTYTAGGDMFTGEKLSTVKLKEKLNGEPDHPHHEEVVDEETLKKRKRVTYVLIEKSLVKLPKNEH
jgi:hypothetical protein